MGQNKASNQAAEEALETRRRVDLLVKSLRCGRVTELMVRSFLRGAKAEGDAFIHSLILVSSQYALERFKGDAAGLMRVDPEACGSAVATYLAAVQEEARRYISSRGLEGSA